MTAEEFDAYVTQIIAAAATGDAVEMVGNLLVEFQDKCILSGRYTLIDRLREQLNAFDDRKPVPPR